MLLFTLLCYDGCSQLVKDGCSSLGWAPLLPHCASSSTTSLRPPPFICRPVDPSLYIHRFADRLGFGRAMQAVAQTAIRLVRLPCPALPCPRRLLCAYPDHREALAPRGHQKLCSLTFSLCSLASRWLP